MLLIFILLLLAVVSAWVSRRRLSLVFFTISMGLAVLVFIFHVTTRLSLQL